MSIIFLRVKVRSLAEEARIIRHEERRAKPIWRRSLTLGENSAPDYTFFHLRNHRVFDVRREARAALLAYGFLRGKSYFAIEAKCYEEPDWTRVAELVKKYGEPQKYTRDSAFAAVKLWAKVNVQSNVEKSDA
jgi:hypothetical protein